MSATLERAGLSACHGVRGESAVLRGRIREANGCCVHVTHRCHNRAYLLKFRRDRRAYVERLRQATHQFDIDVLDYAVTSNHVHILIWISRGEDLSAAMQYVQGSIAQAYNRRKGRWGAFWSGRYHPTLVQSGPHLSRCLFHIGLNMVRAGAVGHPLEWGECGVHELAGERKRYRVLNVERLQWCLGMPGDLDGFRSWYRRTLDEMARAAYRVRESHWTECVAVGNREWVDALRGRIIAGRASVCKLPDSTGLGVAEHEPVYGLKASRRAADALLFPSGGEDAAFSY